jgi:hypothetical protein
MALGTKPYTLPMPCGQATFHHVDRPGFFHCSGCRQDRPLWDFYINKVTGQRIEGGCIACRRKKGRKGGSRAIGGGGNVGRPRGSFSVTAPEVEPRPREYPGRRGRTVPIRDPETGRIMGSRSLREAS